MRTIGEAISRTKNLVKGMKQDAFLTDRFVYALLLKHGKFLMRRQDSQNKVMKFNPVFQTLNFVELVDTDKVQAHCIGLSSDCTIKRTVDRLPSFMEGYWGPLIRSVTSVDGSEEFMPTYPTAYLNISRQKNFRYNSTRYYWFVGGHLFFPNLPWDAVRIEGVFEEDISRYNCDCADDCIARQDQLFNVPDFLDAEMDKLILQDLGILEQTPSDAKDDKQSVLR